MGMPRALILAAGSGTRLMPLTADRPKVLVDIADRVVGLGIAVLLVWSAYALFLLLFPG